MHFQKRLSDMKKVIYLSLILLFVIFLFSCEWGNSFDSSENQTVKIEHILTIEPPNELFVTVQGAIFDGEHYYIAFVNNYLPTETAIIVKTDKHGNEVKRSAILPLDHANSITLIENGNLIIAHCQSPDGHYYRYSVVDKDTFTITETKDLDEPFMSIAYCREKKCFVSGEWNGDKMNVYGKDLQILYSFNVNFKENSFPQSYFCTEDAIYAVRCINDGSFHNYLYAFSYEGETLLEYKIDLPRLTEAEAVSLVGADVYIICGDSGKCIVYKITDLI